MIGFFVIYSDFPYVVSFHRLCTLKQNIYSLAMFHKYVNMFINMYINVGIINCVLKIFYRFTDSLLASALNYEKVS